MLQITLYMYWAALHSFAKVLLSFCAPVFYLEYQSDMQVSAKPNSCNSQKPGEGEGRVSLHCNVTVIFSLQKTIKKEDNFIVMDSDEISPQLPCEHFPIFAWKRTYFSEVSTWIFTI